MRTNGRGVIRGGIAIKPHRNRSSAPLIIERNRGEAALLARPEPGVPDQRSLGNRVDCECVHNHAHLNAEQAQGSKDDPPAILGAVSDDVAGIDRTQRGTIARVHVRGRSDDLQSIRRGNTTHQQILSVTETIDAANGPDRGPVVNDPCEGRQSVDRSPPYGSQLRRGVRVRKAEKHVAGGQAFGQHRHACLEEALSTLGRRGRDIADLPARDRAAAYAELHRERRAHRDEPAVAPQLSNSRRLQERVFP